MAIEVIMPRVDMDMTEGKIAAWYVKNGDPVSKGQLLFDIETDKATMEVEAEADGVIEGIREELGVPIPVGEPVAWLRAVGEPMSGAPAGAQQPVASTNTVNRAPPETAPVMTADLTAGAVVGQGVDAVVPVDTGASDLAVAPPSPPLRASPRARQLAGSLGLDLSRTSGSGPGGAVLARDLPAITDGQKARRQAGLAGQEGGALHLQWLHRAAGTPLVLLHGFGADLGSWRPLAQMLDGLPVVGVDLPNHGKSPAGTAHTLDDIARSVRDRLDAEGLGTMHVVGHSLGGGVAIALAGMLGERLRSLTLIAPVGLGPHLNGDFIDGLCRARTPSGMRAWLQELVADQAVVTGSFVATAWQQLSSPGRQQALQAMARHLMPDGIQVENLRPRLADVRAPVKVLWGSADRIVPLHHADGLPAMVALHRLPGVGHLPQVEAAEIAASLVRQQVAAGR